MLHPPTMKPFSASNWCRDFLWENGSRNVFSALAENLYRKIMRWNRWHLGLGPLMDTVVFLVMPAILIVGKVYFHHTLGELLAMAYAFSPRVSAHQTTGSGQ